MARFDSVAHLEHWQVSGRFPRIHDDLYNLVRQSVGVDAGTVCDVGSSTGLLTARLHLAGYEVYGIEPNQDTAQRGSSWGTYTDDRPAVVMAVTPDTLAEFGALLTLRGTKVIVARRVLPELEDHGVQPELFGPVLDAAGIEHVFIEGRATRKGSTHRLSTLASERRALVGWRTEEVSGACAHLVPAG